MLFRSSLDKIRNLPVKIVLPGHRNFFTDLAGRIDELKIHHETRANEVLEVLGKNIMSAYDIAAGMTWDIDCENWEQFPVTQKWFAVAEALAHLLYLESERRIKKHKGEKTDTFSAN